MNENKIYSDYPLFARMLDDFEETDKCKELFNTYYPDIEEVTKGIRTVKEKMEADTICTNAFFAAVLLGFIAGFIYSTDLRKEINKIQGRKETG